MPELILLLGKLAITLTLLSQTLPAPVFASETIVLKSPEIAPEITKTAKDATSTQTLATPQRGFTGEVLRATVTAYSSSIDETDSTPFITASGTSTRQGIIACPRKYPFGTMFEINREIYNCQDRTHSKTDGWDIWMPSKQEAFVWGRKIVWIKVLN